MPKLNLDQTYVLSGKFYGPGEVELDDVSYAALKARMDGLAKAAKPDAAAAAPATEPARKPAGRE